MRPCLRTVYHWVAQFVDPFRIVRGLSKLGPYLKDWYRYVHLPGAEPVHWVDSWPQLHDQTVKTPFDPHYFWTSGWATRRIVVQQPKQHVDIGSQVMFVNLLSAVLPVTFVDYRPLKVNVTGLTSCRGDILRLPFADGAVASLSCLHVAEHIGLGRYGDPLNPSGTLQACMELVRVLAPGGNLFFAVPIGQPRVCFNAHRIHSPNQIFEYFNTLELVELSGVDDGGNFRLNIKPENIDQVNYGCGLFWFKK